MGVYEQLRSDADREAALQLARYLIETEGNRFYGQDIASVRNHIAGNDQLMEEAHKFKKKFAEMMPPDEKLVGTIPSRLPQAAADPVQEMMQRYRDPNARKAFSEKIEKLLKQRAKRK